MNITDRHIDQLSLAAVTAQPIEKDWNPVEGPYLEDRGWTWYQAFAYEYERDGQPDLPLTLIAHENSVTHVVLGGAVCDLWEYEAYAEEALVEDPHNPDGWVLPADALTEDDFATLREVEPYRHGAEGPMMNYYYPLEDLRGLSCEHAAAELADSCVVVVVEVEGTYALALAGGGMDLSWDIIAAHVALGFLPPVHFEPPDFARFAPAQERFLIECARRSAEVLARKMQRRLELLDERLSRSVPT